VSHPLLPRPPLQPTPSQQPECTPHWQTVNACWRVPPTAEVAAGEMLTAAAVMRGSHVLTARSTRARRTSPRTKLWKLGCRMLVERRGRQQGGGKATAHGAWTTGLTHPQSGRALRSLPFLFVRRRRRSWNASSFGRQSSLFLPSRSCQICLLLNAVRLLFARLRQADSIRSRIVDHPSSCSGRPCRRGRMDRDARRQAAVRGTQEKEATGGRIPVQL
jgi:hypothetical protein